MPRPLTLKASSWRCATLSRLRLHVSLSGKKKALLAEKESTRPISFSASEVMGEKGDSSFDLRTVSLFSHHFLRAEAEKEMGLVDSFSAEVFFSVRAERRAALDRYRPGVCTL